MKRPRRTVGSFNSKGCGNRASLVLLLQLTASLVAPRTLADESAGQDTPIEFHIPSLPVPAALSEFARQARVQLFFISDEFEAVRANAVFGTYSTQQALDLLLAQTGLAARHSPEFGVKLRVVTSPEPAAVAGPGARAPPSGDSDGTPGVVEDILVTGSRIHGAGSRAPVVTITRHEIDRAGYTTLEALVQSVPQNFGSGATQDSFTSLRGASNAIGANVGQLAGGASVNLRGLGAGATLVLLNGRRINASGLSARFFDISAIPLPAIERVELLTDGASAIYGADAIAGVVNFILRDDYEGAETELRYGRDGKGDTSELLFGQVFGETWDGGRLFAAYEYYRHDELANADRRFAASSDLSSLGGTDWRVTGGNPANISAGGLTYAIPAAQDGTSLTVADFPVDSNGVPTASLNRHDIRAGEDFLPEQERHGLFLAFAKDVSATSELFAEARFSTRRNTARSDRKLLDIEVPDTNPFFVDPTGTGLSSVTVENYSLRDDLGPIVNRGESDTYGAAVGLRFDIGRRGRGELVTTYSREESTSTLTNLVSRMAVAVAANGKTAATALNPFAEGSNTNPAVLQSLRTDGNMDSAENELWTFGFNLNLDTFGLPGGTVRLASGAELRGESLLAYSVVGAELDAVLMERGTDGSRDIISAYAELSVPLVGADNHRPGIRQLDLTLAARIEDYSDFGSNTNPQFGISWSPTRSLFLRGSYGTSFKAPGLSELDVGNLATNTIVYFPQSFVNGGIVPFPTILLTGGNENLEAEEATSWSVGFHWTPAHVGGLSLDVSYFSIDFENRIETPFTDLQSAFDPRFASLLDTDPTPQQIADLVNDPRWQERFGVPAADLLSGAAPVGGISNGRVNNTATSVVRGVDLSLLHELQTAFGPIELGLSGSYVFDFEQALIDADSLTEEIDTLGRPVEFRARCSVTWRRGGWELSGFVNYTDRYTDNVSEPPRPIDSWATVDLSVSFDSDFTNGVLGAARIRFAVENLFDEDPPFADTIGGLGYDSTNADGRGRFVSLQAKIDW